MIFKTASSLKFLMASGVTPNAIAIFPKATSPDDHLKFLKDWRRYVLCDQFFNDKTDGPGYLWFEYKWHVKLLEALSLLVDTYKEERYKFQPASGEQLAAEERKW